MDVPKVGARLPLAKRDAKTVETAETTGKLAGEAVRKEAPDAPGGGGDSFERVGQSIFRALAAGGAAAAAAGAAAGATSASRGAGGGGDAVDDAGQVGAKLAGAVGELVQDPLGSVARTAGAMALGIGNTVRHGVDHVREAVVDRIEDHGLLDEGAGSEGVIHAIDVVAGRTAEVVGEAAGDAAEAAAPIADAAADAATEVAGDVASAVGDAVGEAADAVGDAADAVSDAAGAAWDALTGG